MSIDGSVVLDELLYCLEQNFPAEVTEALLALVQDNSTLSVAWKAWRDWRLTCVSSTRGYWSEDRGGFIDTLRDVGVEDVTFCEDCASVTWLDETTSVYGGESSVCECCIEAYSCCERCEEYVRETTPVAMSYYCDSCRDHYCSWCDQCEEYYYDDGSHDHSGCQCEPPHLRFRFPADGHGTIEPDERFTVELPKGTIDDEGIVRIKQLLWGAVHAINPNAAIYVSEVVDGIGPLWQAKRGNFTKRLSSAFYSQHQIKLPPEVISEVGNLARAHSSEGAEWSIEVTRDLNLSAEDFYHDESCWWGSYSESRCCLKNWGGLGLRTFDGAYNNVTGRAWVQPLNRDLQPTHDTIGAHAFVVFNGYGDLEGYVAARIVAHLTGRTYRKVSLSANGMYVNSDSGFLIADEETAQATERLSFTNFGPHDTGDAYTINQKEAVA